MTERRRHGGGGGGKKFLVWSGWIVAVGLAGNLIWAHVHEDDQGTPQGVITPEMLQGAAFWTPIAASVVMALLGIYWASKAHSQTERTSLVWARRGYVISLVGAVILAIAVFDAELFPRAWLAALAALLFGVQTSIFAMVGFKELRRAETGEGSRRPRPRNEKPAEPPSASVPAEASEPPK